MYRSSSPGDTDNTSPMLSNPYPRIVGRQQLPCVDLEPELIQCRHSHVCRGRPRPSPRSCRVSRAPRIGASLVQKAHDGASCNRAGVTITSALRIVRQTGGLEKNGRGRNSGSVVCAEFGGDLTISAVRSVRFAVVVAGVQTNCGPESRRRPPPTVACRRRSNRTSAPSGRGRCVRCAPARRRGNTGIRDLSSTPPARKIGR